LLVCTCLRWVEGGRRGEGEVGMESDMFGTRIEGEFVADKKIDPLVHLNIAIGGILVSLTRGWRGKCSQQPLRTHAWLHFHNSLPSDISAHPPFR